MHLSFIFFIAVVVLVVFLKKWIDSPNGKGKLSERVVDTKLKLSLDPNIYHVFYDVTIRDTRGDTQIDHVVVSPFGIFVIELKNYAGYIYADKNAQYWTQIVYKKKSQFQNPLRQNYRHIKALSEVLNISEDKIFPIVFFIGDSVFKTPIPEGVIVQDITGYIKMFNEKKFTMLQTIELKNKLATLNEKNKYLRK